MFILFFDMTNTVKTPEEVDEWLKELLVDRRWQALILLPVPVLLLIALFVTEAALSSFNVTRNRILGVTTIYMLLYITWFVTTTETRSKEIDERLPKDIESELGEITSELVALQSTEDDIDVFEKEDEAKAHLKEAVDFEETERAILIEYSSHRGSDIRDALYNHGVELYLLVKRPEMAPGHDEKPAGTESHTEFRSLQAGKIFNQIFGDGLGENLPVKDYENVHIRFYELDAAVRGRKIGDERLYIGWYTHNDPEDNDTSGIWGDINPTIHVPAGHDGFDYLDNFFVGRAAKDLWDHGVSPMYLYEEEEVPWLRKWVQATETDHRLEFLEAISDRDDDGDLNIEEVLGENITGEEHEVRRY